MEMQYLQPMSIEAHKRSSPLSTWVFIAAVIHAVILLGITFAAPEPKKISRAIEITLVSSKTRKAPDDAKHLAQENQIGAGLEEHKPRPNEQKIPKKPKETQKKKKKPKKTKKPKKKTTALHRVITKKKKAKKKVVKAKKTPPKKTEQTKQTKPTKKSEQAALSMEALEKQIAQLGERVKYLQQNSEKTNIKFVNSISAHKFVAAQYVRDWERKVQRIGNLNYPKIARKKGFSGTLSMDVGIDADGRIYSMRIVRSSGHKALDKAALRIVRMSEPFSRLPEPILNELDVLVIRRVWSFSDESGLDL